MLIRDLLFTGSPCISFEFFPPKSDEAAVQLERTISELCELDPAFVSVTYGAGGSTRDKTIDIVSRIRRKAGVEAIAHLTCVGSTRNELGTILEKMAAAGIKNVLALRGDPPKGEDVFTAVDDGFRNANELVAFIREKCGNGLCVGAAAYPEKHVECASSEVDLQNLKKKVDAGVDFLITQLFFDNSVYWKFVRRARAANITVPIVPGILPITNAAQVERFSSECGATLPASLRDRVNNRRHEPAAVMQLGIEHATAQCVDLIAGGAPGVHLYTLNRSSAARSIVNGLRSVYSGAIRMTADNLSAGLVAQNAA
jgi:methylenetetrahydrofolate reductase (NADPH)